MPLRPETSRATASMPPIDNIAAGKAPPVISFPGGLPGFPGATRFVLRRADGPFDAFLVMQSAEDPELRFLMLPCAGGTQPLRAADLEAACAVHGLAIATGRRPPGRESSTGRGGDGPGCPALCQSQGAGADRHDQRHRRAARAGQPVLSPAVSPATSRIDRPAVVRARAVRHIDGRLERARSGRGDR